MQSEELQRQACALVRQYGFILPSAVRAFMFNLADFLQWDDLKKML